MKIEKKQIFFMLLPSILLLMLYYGLYASEHYRSITRLNGFISIAIAEVSTLPTKLAQDKKDLEQIQEKIPKLKEEISKTREQLTQFEKSLQKTTSVETLFRINQILAKNNLVLVKSDFQYQQRQTSEIVEYYEEMQFEKNPNSDTGKLLKLELIGSFENFSKMMSDLNKLSNMIFPIDVTMRKFNKKKNLHQWQITLWI